MSEAIKAIKAFDKWWMDQVAAACGGPAYKVAAQAWAERGRLDVGIVKDYRPDIDEYDLLQDIARAKELETENGRLRAENTRLFEALSKLASPITINDSLEQPSALRDVPSRASGGTNAPAKEARDAASAK
jgi:hypothetical protein